MGVHLGVILIYLSFLLDFLVWPVPSEASTFSLLNRRKNSKIIFGIFLILVFILSLIIYLTPLGLSIMSLFNGEGIAIAPMVILGLFLSLVGRITSIKAALKLRKNEKGIVVDSVFRHSRNPISLGMHFTLAGLVIIFGKWYLWLGFIFYLVNIHLKIKVEEQFLLGKFGQDYTIYKNKTPRYLFKI